jgi:hypothetical protein
MATWRCPNCGTLQSDSSRCFLCERSATSCGTCVMFRASLLGGVGYCALDRRREALSGSERRSCWTATANVASGGFFGLDQESAEAPLGHGLLEVLPVHARQAPLSER